VQLLDTSSMVAAWPNANEIANQPITCVIGASRAA
jgi:hypothetical protein